MIRAVTWDFGQTLAELDTELLARRLAERGVEGRADALERAVPQAWRAYDDAIERGVAKHPWKLLMRSLLEGGGVEPLAVEPSVDWLWEQQPVKNLWRRPIPGMIELVDELRARGVAQAVVSNSEGRLAELVAEMGWGGRFAIVADSGKLGVEKPDAAIFHYACRALGVAPGETAHVGDSLAADVRGALAAGLEAIWFRPRVATRVARAKQAVDASSTRAALLELGLA